MDSTEPSDPMWATFRERHPDVNLVLLPGDGAVEEPAPAPPATTDEARDAAEALVRRVRLIGEMMGVPHDPVQGWARVPGGAYEPTVRLHGSAASEVSLDAEVIEHRLTQLGWQAKARPEPELVWVEGHAGEDFVRVTVVDGIVGVRARGSAVTLDDSAINELMGGADNAH